MTDPDLESALVPYVAGHVWLKRYPVRFAAMDISARLTLLRLRDGSLLAHSPCPIDAALRAEVEAIGPLRHIVAPGDYHYFHVAAWQEAFPEATTWICPGVERKLPNLRFDWLLGDRSPPEWEREIDQVLVRGTRFIVEVAFFHRASRTLILTDLVEYVGDETPGASDRLLRFWWKAVFRMWNRAKPAPEYQMGWRDKAAARESLERILAWDFERVVLAHGDCIDADPKDRLREAWANPLRG